MLRIAPQHFCDEIGLAKALLRTPPNCACRRHGKAFRQSIRLTVRLSPQTVRPPCLASHAPHAAPELSGVHRAINARGAGLADEGVTIILPRGLHVCGGRTVRPRQRMLGHSSSCAGSSAQSAISVGCSVLGSSSPGRLNLNPKPFTLPKSLSPQNHQTTNPKPPP